MIQNLDVYLWGHKVGSLVTYKERYAEKICFYFDPTFLNVGYDIAPLRASISSASVKNGLPVYADSEKLFGGLPSFIADSLPDHWGNKVFNKDSQHKHEESLGTRPLGLYRQKRHGSFGVSSPSCSRF